VAALQLPGHLLEYCCPPSDSSSTSVYFDWLHHSTYLHTLHTLPRSSTHCPSFLSTCPQPFPLLAELQQGSTHARILTSHCSCLQEADPLLAPPALASLCMAWGEVSTQVPLRATPWPSCCQVAASVLRGCSIAYMTTMHAQAHVLSDPLTVTAKCKLST
jgi:hypothetical protein